MLRNKRKILASMLAMSLIMQFETAGVLADTKNGDSEKKPIFSDVPEKRWSNDIIESFYNNGIIEGYPDGTFRPKEKITRAEVATIIKKLNLDEVKEPIPFTDVSTDMWYSDAVDNSVKIGLAVGYPDGTFKPEKNITRSEAFKVTAKSYKKVDTDDITLDFLDQHTVEPWAEEFQKQLVYYEKLEGYPDQTIKGGKDITREEFIKLIGHIVDEDFDIQANLNSWQEGYVDSSTNTENNNGENKNPVNPVKPVTPPNNGGGNSDDSDDYTTEVVEKSTAPGINQPYEGDTEISGTGVPISTITVTFPDGSTKTAIVDNNGTWSISLKTSSYELTANDKITVVQKEPNKTVSGVTETTVQARGLFKVSRGSETINNILNDTDNKFMSLGKYPNYDTSLYGSNNLVSKEEIEITLYKSNAIKSIGYYFVPLTDKSAYNDIKLPTSQITQITSDKINNDNIINGRYIVVAENVNGEKEVQEIVIKNKRDGSITHPFKVSNPEELKTLANSDKYYEVTKDINLNGISWQPIEGFTGHFYGNDFTISNLTITELKNKDLTDIGLFSTVANGSINNVNLEVDKIDVDVYLKEYFASIVNIGGLVGNVKSDTVISNIDVTIDGKINVTSSNGYAGSLFIGGAIGLVFEENESDYNVTIERLTVNNTKEFLIDNIANRVFECADIGGAIGAVGWNYYGSTYGDMYNIKVQDIHVINENNKMESSSFGTTGGAIGLFINSYMSDVLVENKGAIIENGTSSNSGGAIGEVSISHIEDVTVVNENITMDGSSSGGVIGKSSGSDLLNFDCINTNIIEDGVMKGSTIEGYYFAGGMIGYSSANSTIENFNVQNINTNIIAINYESGGAFGHDNDSVIDIVRITNTNAKIEGDGFAGGAIGRSMRGTFTDFTCTNGESTIIKSMSTGGMIGDSSSDTLTDFTCTNTDETIIDGVTDAGGMIGGASSVSLEEIKVVNNNGTLIESRQSGGMVGTMVNSQDVYFDEKFEVECYGDIIGDKSVGAFIGLIKNCTINNIGNIMLKFDAEKISGTESGTNSGKYYGEVSEVTFIPELLVVGDENDLYPTESRLLILPEIPKIPELPVTPVTPITPETPVTPELPKDEIIIDIEDLEGKEDLEEIEIIEDKEDGEIIDETEDPQEIEDTQDIEDENTDIDIIEEEKEEPQDIDVDIIEETEEIL